MRFCVIDFGGGVRRRWKKAPVSLAYLCLQTTRYTSYTPAVPQVRTTIYLRARYAMPGTDTAYRATRTAERNPPGQAPSYAYLHSYLLRAKGSIRTVSWYQLSYRAGAIRVARISASTDMGVRKYACNPPQKIKR
eukprot:3775623-Rhodomonas_salina.2